MSEKGRWSGVDGGSAKEVECGPSTVIGPVAGGAELKSESAIATKEGKRCWQDAISTTENGCGKRTCDGR